MTQLVDTERLKTEVDLITTVESYLGPGRKNGQWYEWLCPFHTEYKSPSFKVKQGDTKFKCYGCGQYGDVIDFIGQMENKGFKEVVEGLGSGYLLQVADPKKALEIQAGIKAENERKRAEQEAERQKTAQERLAALTGKVDWYHSQVGQALNYWHSQGLTDYTINLFRLGYAPECPTYRQSPSYVIPYFQQNQLISIRHRLANPNGCGKYRPEFSPLPNQLFNADALQPGEGDVNWNYIPDSERLLVEGEVKAMVLTQVGLPAAAIAGKSAWDSAWACKFKHLKRVYVALDPGAEPEAWKIGQDFLAMGIEAIVPVFPCKPDDLMVVYGARPEDVLGYLWQGRRVR
jgi:hypothetical protein